MPRTFANKLLTLTLFVGFAVAAVPVRALLPKPHRGANPREQIISMEQQWREAQLADDIPAMEKLLSDNFIGITISGQVVTKTQQLERMRRRVVVVKRFEASDTKIKLIANGQVAIVNALAQVEGVSEARSIDGSFRYTRVYQRLPNGTWKITSFEATRIPKDVAPAPAATPAPAPPPKP